MPDECVRAFGGGVRHYRHGFIVLLSAGYIYSHVLVNYNGRNDIFHITWDTPLRNEASFVAVICVEALFCFGNEHVRLHAVKIVTIDTFDTHSFEFHLTKCCPGYFVLVIRRNCNHDGI